MALTQFVDQYARNKRKLRISVTDRCNFKCVYCMPEHPAWVAKHQLLSFEALEKFCEFMVQRGIEHIRITGGEPLMRQGIIHFIERLNRLKAYGLKRISMTSNGHYLTRYAVALKAAGLDDLNISLDSLNPSTFLQLTQKPLQPVLDGIAVAKAAGFAIKINTVLLRGQNDTDIVPLFAWSKAQGFVLRFIEFMPLDGDDTWHNTQVVTEQEILTTLAQHYRIQQQAEQHDPARLFWVDGYPLGIISTISHSFCGNCDRVRLTAQGELFHCLFAREGLQIKSQIEQLYHPEMAQQLEQKLQRYIWQKPRGYAAISRTPRKISMHMLGG